MHPCAQPRRCAAAAPRRRTTALPRRCAAKIERVDVTCPMCIRLRACVLSCAHVLSRRTHVLARTRDRSRACGCARTTCARMRVCARAVCARAAFSACAPACAYACRRLPLSHSWQWCCVSISDIDIAESIQTSKRGRGGLTSA
jgi:hypothetical protein